ncbi:hypothetical protein C8Q77DRAFT_1160334 [Trametes polyzona]|nr:hypothetical protein C8Q77DRAFT_1160334 [Trametes polyzona]
MARNLTLLPPELLDLVLSEACTDDGYTGRSLGLVSKAIRAASFRHALSSVALYGPYQVSAFAQLLEERSSDGSRVRNLYLTDRRRVWMEYAPGQSKDQWIKERTEEEFSPRDPQRHYSSKDIIAVLILAAPRLQSLTMLLFDYDDDVLSLVFPVLEELTLHSSTLYPWVTPYAYHCAALRRLHIIQDDSLAMTVVQKIAALAPQLTHLRISRLNTATGNLLTGLENMLVDEPKKPVSPPVPTLPRSLVRVIVQLSQQALYDTAGTLQLFTSPKAHMLRNLALEDQRRRITMIRPVLWDATAFEGYDNDVEYYTTIKSNWLSRNSGVMKMWHPELVAEASITSTMRSPTR